MFVHLWFSSIRFETCVILNFVYLHRSRRILLGRRLMPWHSTSRIYWHRPPPFSSTLCMTHTELVLILSVDTPLASGKVLLPLFPMGSGSTSPITMPQRSWLSPVSVTQGELHHPYFDVNCSLDCIFLFTDLSIIYSYTKFKIRKLWL